MKDLPGIVHTSEHAQEGRTDKRKSPPHHAGGEAHDDFGEYVIRSVVTQTLIARAGHVSCLLWCLTQSIPSKVVGSDDADDADDDVSQKKSP